MESHEVIVVGGGPVGLYAAAKLEELGIDYVLLEASHSLGGQLTALYPDKHIDDVAAFSSLPAKELASRLAQRIKPSRLVLGAAVSKLEEKDGKVIVFAADETYKGDFAIVATGLGFQKPRTMGLPNEEKCRNILYALTDLSLMKGKRIVIFGGGDSALDWAREISFLSPHVSLVHRRREFRGNPKTIEGRPIAIYVPFIPESLTEKDGLCLDVTIKNVEDGSLMTLPCDYLLVNYGLTPSLSVLGLPSAKNGFGILVGRDQRATERIYAVGDCASFPDKKKRIQPGFEEADAAIASLSSRLAAEKKACSPR